MMQSQIWDDAIPRNLNFFVGGLKLLAVTVKWRLGSLVNNNASSYLTIFTISLCWV